MARLIAATVALSEWRRLDREIGGCVACGARRAIRRGELCADHRVPLGLAVAVRDGCLSRDEPEMLAMFRARQALLAAAVACRDEKWSPASLSRLCDRIEDADRAQAALDKAAHLVEKLNREEGA